MKIKNTIISLCLVLVLMLVALPFSVSAANATMETSVSSSTVYLNSTLTATIKLTCADPVILGTKGAVSYGNNFEFVSISSSTGDCTTANKNGVIDFTWDNFEPQSSATITLVFKAVKVGDTSIVFETTTECLDDSEAPKIKKDTKYIKVVDKSALSGNAKLKALTLSAGTLSPAFDPDVTSYKINVDYSVTQVLVSATTQEAAAKIDVQGSSKMAVGDNTRTVVVTAPNGTVKKYTLNIYRAAQGEVVAPPVPDGMTTNPYEIKVDGEIKYMVNTYKDITAPNGFSPALHKINEADIPVLQDVVNDRVIVYATKEDDTAGMFYLYDKENGSFSPFKHFVTEGLSYIALDYTENTTLPDGYQYAKVTVADYTVNGIKYNDANLSDFVIFYAENASGGKEFYRYDAKEKTIQRAGEFTLLLNSIAEDKNEGEKSVISRFMELEIKNKLIVISAVLLIVVIIVLIVIIIIKATKKVPTQEALEAAREQEFMEGFGETTHLYLDDDYEDDEDSPLNDDFTIKDDEQ